MAKVMKYAAWASAMLTLLCAVLYGNWQAGILLDLAITFGTTTYHLIMRLLVGWSIHGIFRNRMNYRAPWFQVRPFEEKLYRALGVKQWKSRIPTYDPSFFDSGKRTWDEIAQATCQAEIVHEVIIALSFLPLFATIVFGAFWAFALTSLLAACVDGVFVILQRFNRPRLLRLIGRKEKEIKAK